MENMGRKKTNARCVEMEKKPLYSYQVFVPGFDGEKILSEIVRCNYYDLDPDGGFLTFFTDDGKAVASFKDWSYVMRVDGIDS